MSGIPSKEPPPPEEVRRRIQNIATRIRRFRRRLTELEADAELNECPRCRGDLRKIGKEVTETLYSLQRDSHEDNIG